MNRFTQSTYSQARELQFFVLHSFTLFCISLFCFTRNTAQLLTGLDGPAIFTSPSEVQFTFFGISPTLHSNIFEGLGNTFVDNLTLMPKIYDHELGTYSLGLLFTWFALQLFISVLIAGWNYSFTHRVRYLSAWLLTILFLPYFENFRIYNITEAGPNFITFILVFVLMDVGINRMGRKNWLNTFFFGGILLFALVMGLIISPTRLVIISPLCLLLMVHALIKAKDPKEFWRKLIMGAFILFATIVTGWLQYVFGLILYTAANVFSAYLTGGYHSLIYVSILFQGQIPSSTWGPSLFYTSILGTLLAVYQSAKFRSIGITILLAQLLIVGGGALLMFQPKPWIGPAPIYFEALLFPFYALFTGYLIVKILGLIPSFKLSAKWYDFSLPCIFSLVILLSVTIQPPNTVRKNSYSLPPLSTPITDILEKEIALDLNSLFWGRVINVVPNMDWIQQCAYFKAIDGATGNDHQSSGLWLKHIPTLHEFNQLITPSFFRIYRRFLAHSGEPFFRSWTSFSTVNLKILKLLGVRFIITTIPEINETKLRAHLRLDKNSLPDLYLHELQKTNTRGLSAKRVIRVSSFQAAENFMDSIEFNLEDAVIISNAKSTLEHYVTATKSKLSVEKGGFHLQAVSTGKTLLILPIEYSHCLNINSLSGPAPKIIRVDAALTGVIFNRNVDVLLDNMTGPFTNPRCKIADYFDFKKIWSSIT